MIEVLKKNGLQRLADRFIEISYNSHKWEKWMTKNSSADEEEKAMIAGHYIYSMPEVIELKAQMQSELGHKNICLDEYLKNAVKAAVYRYLKDFRMVS